MLHCTYLCLSVCAMLQAHLRSTTLGMLFTSVVMQRGPCTNFICPAVHKLVHQVQACA